MEITLKEKHHTVDKRIGDLRSQTMKYTFVDPKTGAVKSNGDPRLAELQEQTQVEEGKLARINEISARVDAILSESGAESVRALSELKEEHKNTLNSAPWRAWDNFRLFRERPPGHGGYPHLLPSDLAALPAYKEIEDAERANMEEAKAALALIDPAMQEITDLMEEAASL